MTENTQELLDESNAGEVPAETTAPAPKAPAVEARLCKGAMPMPLVWFIKFFEPQDAKSEVAKKYFTTPGKISDIQTAANQKYIVKDMTFSAAEIDAAVQKVKENFVRGQQENAAKPGSVTKRGLATTKPGDESYSLAVLEKIRGLGAKDGAVTLEAARASHNATNPRKKAEPKAETTAAEAGSQESDGGTDESLLEE